MPLPPTLEESIEIDFGDQGRPLPQGQGLIAAIAVSLMT